MIKAFIQSIPFWTLVVIQFWLAIGWFVADDIPRNILQFAAFSWGVVIGILAEKGGLHPFNYGKKHNLSFIVIGDKCSTCEPIQSLKKAMESLGSDVSIRDAEITKKSLR